MSFEQLVKNMVKQEEVEDGNMTKQQILDVQDVWETCNWGDEFGQDYSGE